MIEIDNLTKDFGSFRAVDKLSFQVNKGEVLGFLGPNGAGKSTSMKMITGYMAPSFGTARILGQDVRKKPVSVKKVMGYLPEGAPAWPDMTAASFLNFIADIRGLDSKQAKDAVAKAIERTNLKSVLHQPIQTLSKGFKRRVGLAQAILHDPQVLIMDEPTDGLDPNQKQDVRSLILEMASEKAIIISTHILEEVEEICDRAIIIDRGRIVADETPEILEARSKTHNAVKLHFSKNEMEKALAILKGSPRLYEIEQLNDHIIRILSPDRKPILQSVQGCLEKADLQAQEVLVEKGRLDDVFRSLTKSDVDDSSSMNKGL